MNAAFLRIFRSWAACSAGRPRCLCPHPTAPSVLLRPLALAVFAAALAACSPPAADPAAVARVGEADVARVQARAFVATQRIDADIAAIEAEAAAADSVRQIAYAPVLERLLEDRRRLEVRIDSLAPLPRAAFDTTTAAIGRQVARLRAAVGRARFDAASDAASLGAATAARLARFDARLAASRAAAPSDTTGRLGAALDSLAADRARLDARIEAFADTTAPAFTRLRQATVRDAAVLERKLGQLAPDSTRIRS